MATYILLAYYTKKPMENVKQSVNRLDAVRKAFKTRGAELRDFYFATGPYAFVIVIEAPDDETIAKCTLDLASDGRVAMETIRVLKEDEYRKIIAARPSNLLKGRRGSV